MNILTAMKKTTMQKSASESRKKLDSISKQSHRSKSEIDLAAVPGSCSNIKNLFEANDNGLVNDINVQGIHVTVHVHYILALKV